MGVAGGGGYNEGNQGFITGKKEERSVMRQQKPILETLHKICKCSNFGSSQSIDFITFDDNRKAEKRREG